jgi:cell division protease FtsH
MVCNWGMSEDMGPQTFGDHQELMFLGREVARTEDYSEDTRRKIDAEVNRLLRESYARATKIVSENREKLRIVAELLLERETLDGYEVREIVKHGRVLSDAERAAFPAAEREDAETDQAGPRGETVPPLAPA